MTLKYDSKYVKIHSNYEAMLAANPDKIVWRRLSSSPATIELITANQDEINWVALSSNPAAIELLTVNPDKINWNWLSTNPAAIELLTANRDKFDWERFCAIPFLEYDYVKIEKERAPLGHSIIAAMHHPARVQKWLGESNEIDDYMN